MKNIYKTYNEQAIIFQFKTIQNYLNDKQVKEKWLKNKLELWIYIQNIAEPH